MDSNFEIPATIAKSLHKNPQATQCRLAIEMMLYCFHPLLSIHLNNAVGFQNKQPPALTWAAGFVEAIDQYIAYL
jgi:hypothetical protein